MARPKGETVSVVERSAVAGIRESHAPKRACASKLPRVVGLELSVMLSLALGSLLYSLATRYIAEDFIRVSGGSRKWCEIGVLAAWKTFELGLGLCSSYGPSDIASLSLLANGPFLFLLRTFYNVPLSTVLVSLAIDTSSTYLPIRFQRLLSAGRTPSPFRVVRNRDISADCSIQAFATILSAGIYSVVIYAAYASYLPITLVLNFKDIPSISAVHESNYITLLPTGLIAGLAATSFIFKSVTTTGADDVPEFDPASASFCETLKYNVWGYSARTKAVIKRTAILVIASGVNTFIRTIGTIQGVEPQGAAAYSAMWAAATLLTGLALSVVGAV